MEKIDSRKLKPEDRHQLRLLVIRLRQQAGMKAEEMAQMAGVHASTIRDWLGRAEREGVGSLTEKPRGRPVGACRKLTLVQELWLREQIVDQNPQQMSLPFALWTRRAIGALIQPQFRVTVQVRLIGKYLKRWGFTPQRPIKRALEQRPEQVARWLNETYPAWVAKARTEGAVIYFGDETAVREDANWVRGYAPKGQTPVLATPTRWDKLSMISAISPRGEVAFRIVEGIINAERFIEFLAALIDGAPHKIILVVDNLRVHPANVVSAWLADKLKRIELAFVLEIGTIGWFGSVGDYASYLSVCRRRKAQQWQAQGAREPQEWQSLYREAVHLHRRQCAQGKFDWLPNHAVAGGLCIRFIESEQDLVQGHCRRRPDRPLFPKAWVPGRVIHAAA